MKTMSNDSTSVKAKLKKADSVIRQYVSELEKRNAKLQLRIVRLEADKTESENRMRALEKQSKKRPTHAFNVFLQSPYSGRQFPESEKEARLVEEVKALGYRVEKTA